MANTKPYNSCGRFETYIRSKSIALACENFNGHELSQLLNIDYRNALAYIAGRKVMPLKYCFEILDYLNCNVVVFRRD